LTWTSLIAPISFVHDLQDLVTRTANGRDRRWTARRADRIQFAPRLRRFAPYRPFAQPFPDQAEHQAQPDRAADHDKKRQGHLRIATDEACDGFGPERERHGSAVGQRHHHGKEQGNRE
jgi:hypothetical protein